MAAPLVTIEPVAVADALQSLGDRLEALYRQANPKASREMVRAWVERGFRECRDAHSDFDLYGYEMRILASFISVDYTVADPTIYLEILYVTAKNADFTADGRARVALLKAELQPPAAGTVQ